MGWKRSHVVRIVLASAVLSCPPLAPAADVALNGATVRFHLHRDYLIIVQVTLNGVGPLDFLVDTGCSTTTIDPELDRQLKAPEIGGATVALLAEVRRNRKVLLNEIRVGPAAAVAFPVLVDKLSEETALVPSVRGILGEDFLKAFDLLIDYDRSLLSFNESAPDGERLQFEDAGAYRDKHTFNRVMIKVGFPGAGGNEAVLQLDTAAWVVELFPASHLVLSSGGVSTSARGSVITSGKSRSAYVPAKMRIGATEFRNVTVSIRQNDVASDAVGLLPAAMFGSIYISHSGGFVILNPRSTGREPRHNSLELAALAER
jgi:hypothetical protein